MDAHFGLATDQRRHRHNLEEVTHVCHDECLRFLFELLHPDAWCPACGSLNQFYRAHGKRCYTCVCGEHHIYPSKGTVFEASPLPLTTWFQAIELTIAGEDQLPVREYQRTLGVSYPTAWRMRKAIRSRLPNGRSYSFADAIQRMVQPPPPSS